MERGESGSSDTGDALCNCFCSIEAFLRAVLVCCTHATRPPQCSSSPHVVRRRVRAPFNFMMMKGWWGLVRFTHKHCLLMLSSSFILVAMVVDRQVPALRREARCGDMSAVYSSVLTLTQQILRSSRVSEERRAAIQTEFQEAFEAHWKGNPTQWADIQKVRPGGAPLDWYGIRVGLW